MSKGRKTLRIEVTTDEYELPVAVADNPYELGEMVGVKPESIRSSISHNKKINAAKRKYMKVEIDEDEE